MLIMINNSSFKLNSALLSLLIVSTFCFTFSCCSETIRCPKKQVSTPTNSSDNEPSYYECPSPYEIREYTDCCPHINSCCPPSTHTERISSQVIYLISITGITICIVFMITFLICLFHPSCPSYNSCHKNYTRDETALADKMGEASSLFDEMPGETSPIGNTMVISHPIDDRPIQSDNRYSGDTPEVPV